MSIGAVNSRWGGDACEKPGTRSETVTGTRYVEAYTASVTLVGSASNYETTAEAITATPYPFAVNGYTLYATRVSATWLPEEQTFQGNGTYASTTVEYQVDYAWDPRWDLDFEFRQTMSPTLQRRPISSTGWFWRPVGNSSPASWKPALPDEMPGIAVPAFVIQREYTGLQERPTYFLTYNGSINQQAWNDRWSGLTFPARTLMFESGSLDVAWVKEGNNRREVWNMSFTLHYQYPAWDQFWISKYNTTLEMVDGQGNRAQMYPEMVWTF